MKSIFIIAIAVAFAAVLLIPANDIFADSFVLVSSIETGGYMGTMYCIGYENIPLGTNSVWGAGGET